MSIPDAAAYTGLSKGFIRKMVKANECPFITIGAKYMVNIPGLIQKLEADTQKIGG